MKKNIEKIKEFELLLLDDGLRKSKQKLNELIDDEFIEIGISGKIYNKQDVLNSLPYENARKFDVNDFNFLNLNKNIILTTYKTDENLNAALRSSIWRKSDNGWKLIFHQGTKI